MYLADRERGGASTPKVSKMVDHCRWRIVLGDTEIVSLEHSLFNCANYCFLAS
jgi:hypothetical protein